MKIKIFLLGIFLCLGNSAIAQDWSRAGGYGGGPNPNIYVPLIHAPVPADGIWIRQVGTNILNIKKGGWTEIEGEVSSESDGLAILVTDNGEIALKNYPGEITNGKKISVAALRNGIYKWGDIPLQIWDCGKPYVPPPPTPEQIKAAQEAVEITAQREKQKQFRAQSNAVVWLQSEATNGDVSAQYSLGEHYLNGQGCETNREQAIYWFTQAANQGDLEASNKLSQLKSP